MMNGLPDPAFLARRRAALARHPSLVGLDFVEVLRSADQMLLRLHFLGGDAPLQTLRRDHLRLDPAGLEVIDLKHTTTSVVDVSLRSDAARPGTRFTVLLVDNADVDPFFDRSSFILDIDEPLLWEPGSAKQADGPPPASAPTIDYLARDFRGFRQLMQDRLSALLPGRQDHPADLLTVLIELIAYEADQLSYAQDAVATEAYLGTARLRTSVRRHARLMGYTMHEGCSARVWASLRVRPGAAPVTLPEGTPLLTGVLDGRVVLSSADYEAALNRRPEVFETLHAATLRPELNAIPLYSWGAARLTVPKGATQAVLRGRLNGLLRRGDLLLIEQRQGTSPQRAHPVRLVADPESMEDQLGEDLVVGAASVPLTLLRWHPEDALPFPLVLESPGTPSRRHAVALANIVLADHGRTMASERLPPPTDSVKRYQPTLSRHDLTSTVPYRHKDARERSAAAAMTLAPEKARPCVLLSNRGIPWTSTQTLLTTGATSAAFVVEMSSDRRATLRFGDGEFGRRPPADAAFQASFRVGTGRRGNLGVDALTHVVTDNLDIEGIRNPVGARGGAEPESLEQVRCMAPRDHLRQSRWVTPADYAAACARFPGVRRAVGAAAGGRPTPILVTVERDDRLPLDDAFADDLREFLEQGRMLGHQVQIRPAHYLPLQVRVTVYLERGVRPSDAREGLARALGSDAQLGEKGFFHPDNFDFGRRLNASEVEEQALQIPGVIAADIALARLRPLRGMGVPERATVIIPSYDTLLRLDNDPTAPQFGELQLTLQVGERP